MIDLGDTEEMHYSKIFFLDGCVRVICRPAQFGWDTGRLAGITGLPLRLQNARVSSAELTEG